ncbi:hypothetical protein NK6_4031 [Bradyrhizobium diazoefficiens]|uniref:Uncharacterized protein n=1 Tax=Bradyrhizobium diazoefficiens TaxID=1355477 RepID=A0A0E4BQ68_9BRAD|nr:hypothetical protein NK6_4031 [Bradyrhizobium diazoefficiens]
MKRMPNPGPHWQQYFLVPLFDLKFLTGLAARE